MDRAPAASVLDGDQLRAPFHLDPPVRERLREHGFDVHLPHEGEMGEGRVRQGEFA